MSNKISLSIKKKNSDGLSHVIAKIQWHIQNIIGQSGTGKAAE